MSLETRKSNLVFQKKKRPTKLKLNNDKEKEKKTELNLIINFNTKLIKPIILATTYR